ncbi:LysR family transcriptional regulator [Falsirhodobacter deserti]|uniref:LysR family transcriptional regulator n=1 Tax=Falsirhodobacter deserti TaxID=1365611 RepID=UPI000FE2BD38|nr:LysR substrate-binding domain-containing protein [Falsirhodobacter deserti]
MTPIAKLVPSARALFIFEAAARTGSFSAAAREFNVTQPSVSRSVAQLEAALHIRLFLRGPTGTTLTPEGEEIFRAVQGGIDGITRAIAAVQGRAARKRVNLSFSSSFATHWLIPCLRDFKLAFPDVELRLDLAQGMLADPSPDTDIATRIVADGDPRYHIRPFAPEVILPVCSPAYLAEHGPLADGAGHAFLNLDDEHAGHWATILGHRRRLDDTGTCHRLSDYSVALQAAGNGEGVALGWVSVVAGALRRGALVPASIAHVRTGRWHSLISPRARGQQSPIPEICGWLIDSMEADLHAVLPGL